MASKNYYELLGLNFRATYEEIRAAYRRLAFDLHPDRNPTVEAAAKFQEIMQAYAILSNADSRAQYDAQTLSYVELTGGVNNPGIDLSALYPDDSKVQETAASEFAKHLRKHKRRKALFQTFVSVLLISLLALYGLNPVRVSPDSTNIQQSETSTTNTGTGSGNVETAIKPGLNQRLIIVQGLQGPIGLVGPAGAAGQSGRDGAPGAAGPAGVSGAPGIAGAQGPAGPMGPVGPAGSAGSGGSGGGVTIEAFVGSQGTCTNGGTKFTATDGTITYACNGTSSSSAGGSFAAGTTGFISCDADGAGSSNITVGLQTQFTSGQFKVKQFDVSAISPNCSGKTITFALTIKIAPSTGNVICTKVLSSGNSSDFSTVIDGTTACRVTSPVNIDPFNITAIQASDLDNIGVQIS